MMSSSPKCTTPPLVRCSTDVEGSKTCASRSRSSTSSSAVSILKKQSSWPSAAQAQQVNFKSRLSANDQGRSSHCIDNDIDNDNNSEKDNLITRLQQALETTLEQHAEMAQRLLLLEQRDRQQQEEQERVHIAKYNEKNVNIQEEAPSEKTTATNKYKGKRLKDMERKQFNRKLKSQCENGAEGNHKSKTTTATATHTTLSVSGNSSEANNITFCHELKKTTKKTVKTVKKTASKLSLNSTFHGCGQGSDVARTSNGNGGKSPFRAALKWPRIHIGTNSSGSTMRTDPTAASSAAAPLPQIQPSPSFWAEANAVDLSDAASLVLLDANDIDASSLDGNDNDKYRYRHKHQHSNGHKQDHPQASAVWHQHQQEQSHNQYQHQHQSHSQIHTQHYQQQSQHQHQHHQAQTQQHRQHPYSQMQQHYQQQQHPQTPIATPISTIAFIPEPEEPYHQYQQDFAAAQQECVLQMLMEEVEHIEYKKKNAQQSHQDIFRHNNIRSENIRDHDVVRVRHKKNGRSNKSANSKSTSTGLYTDGVMSMSSIPSTSTNNSTCTTICSSSGSGSNNSGTKSCGNTNSKNVDHNNANSHNVSISSVDLDASVQRIVDRILQQNGYLCANQLQTHVPPNMIHTAPTTDHHSDTLGSNVSCSSFSYCNTSLAQTTHTNTMLQGEGEGFHEGEDEHHDNAQHRLV